MTTEVDRYPVGVPCWIELAPPDLEAAARFYAGVFGWGFEETPCYLIARFNGLEVAGLTRRSPAQEGGRRAAWTTYIRVDDVDSVVARARAAGGVVVMPPFDRGTAGRAATLADPAGARFSLWQPGTLRGGRRVNAPGSWNFSELVTGDVEVVKAFYGALFGWVTRDVNFGKGGIATMWLLPGYGEHLERLDPGIRQRHAEQRVPEGFTDIVAWLVRDDDQASRWTVTFAVDDTDAVVDRASELGGSVIAPPHDTGPTRAAVIADPFGASFTVSRYSQRR